MGYYIFTPIDLRDWHSVPSNGDQLRLKFPKN